jgi:hypothetical protein
MRLLFIALLLIACEGAPGPMGPQGEPGAPGESFTSEVFIGQLTGEWMSNNGDWIVHIYTDTSDVAGIMVFVGPGDAWIRSPMWGYACTDDMIGLTLFNNTVDGEIPEGWMYRVTVIR